MRIALAATAALMIAVSPAMAQAPAPVTFMEKQNNSEILGTDFIGTTVNGKDGLPAGRIINLVFDQNGRIELAIIGVGGLLGVGEKSVAVPFEVLKPETAAGKQVFALDATKDQLKAAPAYKTLNDQAIAQRLSDWRDKAQAGWSDIKGRASKAYEQAKDKVEEATKPKQ
jgi:PRC-barrel domain